ncbi:MAG: hypothetical protein H8E31_13155 [Planctomycetes bacterium]|nr:hypothetical protein [Planctomycetota bacterium]
MFLTALLGAAVLFPPQDAAPEKDPARALYQRLTRRFAEAPALHLDATMKMSMVLPGQEEAQDLGSFRITGRLAKPLSGSMAIEGELSFGGQVQEIAMEMVADGERVYQVDHAQQTAMSGSAGWNDVFEGPFGLDPLVAWAGLELPGFEVIAFAAPDEAHAGLTGLVLETKRARRVIWVDAKERLKQCSFESTAADAMEPDTVTSFASVELPEEIDLLDYRRAVPEGYEIIDLAALGYLEETEEPMEEAEDEGVPPYEKDLLAVGAAAPDVVFTSMEDADFKLSSLRGKTVLLNFWFYH